MFIFLLNSYIINPFLKSQKLTCYEHTKFNLHINYYGTLYYETETLRD